MAPPKAKKSTQDKPNAAKKAQPEVKPNWPAFKPLLPTSDLSLTTVAESQIVVIRNFWTSTLCKNYVSFLQTLPLTTTPGIPKRGEALRHNDRFQINDAHFANRLWIETRLRELICGGESEDGEGEGDGMTQEERETLWGGKVLGLNPSIRIYRYSPNQFFDKHYDESNHFPISTSSGTIPARTTWTILLYLTSATTGCKGGETVFYPDDNTSAENAVVVSLETGMLLLHKHGNDCLLHEGREVLEGEKWVIRTDLAVAK